MQDNKDNNNVNDIDNKNADNSTDTSTTEKKDEYEKVCYVCHRTESRAGKMINMGNNIYINLSPDTRQETDRLFSALSDGGAVEQPLQEMFWGAYYGSLTDKYGIRWMFNCESKE